MAHVQVAAYMLKNIGLKVALQQEKKEFRPTVAVVLECLEDHTFLMVELKSGRHSSYWSFPQGGVESGEGIVDALFRELKEETGIGSDGLTVRKFCHADEVYIHNWERDGYTVGKSRYYFHVTSPVRPVVTLDLKEAVRHQWVSERVAMQSIIQTMMCRESRALREKGESMFKALKAAVS
jgi:8-oxo-dGTP pyrophosphatase MutT (NUDIX family)